MDLENLPPQISEILIKIAPALERISRKGISPESDKSQWQAAILSALMGDRFAQVDQEISGAVGFKIDSKDVSIFSKFTHWISAQNPQFLREWKNTDRRRYERFTNSVSNTSTGLTACYYHLQNIKNYEEIIDGILENGGDFFSAGRQYSTTIGEVDKVSFEYQAFVLSARRTLDYASYGICQYIENSPGDSLFTDLIKKVYKRFDDHHICREICNSINRYKELLDFVYSDRRRSNYKSRKSTRDIISHTEPVVAFAISVSHRGFKYVGGGEDLFFSSEERLSDALNRRIESIVDLLSEIYEIFMNIDFDLPRPS